MSAVVCEWFALCDHEAIGVVMHPILAAVPCCERCALKLDMLDEVVRFDKVKGVSA